MPAEADAQHADRDADDRDADAPTTPRTLGRSRWPEWQLPFDPEWCVHGNSDEDMERADESLLSVADGCIGTRAVLEEAANTPGSRVIVAGVYELDDRLGERIMTVPGWTHLPLQGPVTAGCRVLDLRDGLLTREVRDGDELWLRSVRFACVGRPGTAVLTVDVTSEALGATAELHGPTQSLVVHPSTGGGGVAVAENLRVDLDPETPGRVHLERVATHVTSARVVPQASEAGRALERALRAGTSRLLAEQRRLWARRWEDSDVQVVGDPTSTLAVRFALHHVLSSAGRRGESAVGARGLTGTAYAGHVFWDTEALIVPVLAAVDARAARAVLEYRVRRLDAARRWAAASGRAGARFPWESGATGTDVTPATTIDQKGETVAVHTGQFEEHVSADVAWAAWRLAAWEGDWSLLAGPLGSLVIETARYWVSRVRQDADGRTHLDSVTGPDEYHERVDDNAFTNLMARWNLDRAADLVEHGLRDDVDADEATRWRDVAAALVDNYDPRTGRYEQFAGFDRLEPLLAADVGTPPFAADLVLGATRLLRSQLIKQADVLMAHFLIPDSVAGGSLAPNLDHYLPRTVHGSSLSPSVHATLLARAGRPREALDLLRLAASIDLEDITETTAGGLHMANLGGIWQAVVHGFAGLSVRGPDDRALVLDPGLPPDWEELRFRVRWHGTRVRVCVRHDSVELECDHPMTVTVHGSDSTLEPPGGRVC